MSIYLTLDPEREVIKRLRRIDGLRELLRDAKAELEIVVEQRNPLVSSKGSGDRAGGHNSGGGRSNPAMVLNAQEAALRARIAEYEAVLSDHNRGWSLTRKQKNYLRIRFMTAGGCKQVHAARSIGCSERQARRLETAAIRIMASEVTRV